MAPVTSSLSASNNISLPPKQEGFFERYLCAAIASFTSPARSCVHPQSMRKANALSPPTAAWHKVGFSNCSPRPISCSRHAVIKSRNPHPAHTPRYPAPYTTLCKYAPYHGRCHSYRKHIRLSFFKRFPIHPDSSLLPCLPSRLRS